MGEKTFCRVFRLADNAQFLFLVLPEYPYQKHSYVGLYMSSGRENRFVMSYLTFENPELKLKFLAELRPDDVQDFYVGFRRSDKFVAGALIPASEAFPEAMADL